MTLTKFIKNFGLPFLGQEDFRECYLATDVDARIVELEQIQKIDLQNNNEYREQVATLKARIADLEHCVAGQGERLHDYCRKYAALVAERDEAQRKYALIHDDVDYQQCCAVREQAEQERDQAQAMLARQKESA